MQTFFVGVGRARLVLRHAASLKDRRAVLNSIKQRLRNQGFSVVDLSGDDAKTALLGFSFVAPSSGSVNHALGLAEGYFVGDFYLAEFKRDVLEYGGLGDGDAWLPDWEEEKT